MPFSYLHIQLSDNRGSWYNCTDLQWFMIFWGTACLTIGGISLYICVTQGIPVISSFLLGLFIILGFLVCIILPFLLVFACCVMCIIYLRTDD